MFIIILLIYVIIITRLP